MKISAADLITAHEALSIHGGIELPPSLALRVARITRAVRAEVDTLQDTLNKLLAEHARKDENGKPKGEKNAKGETQFEIIDPPAYASARKELLATEIELPGEPMKLADLGTKPIHSDLLAGLHFAFID